MEKRLKTIRILLIKQNTQIINIPLEVYLQAVVPSEIPASWPMEALKVMSIAARTYSENAIQSPRHDGEADVCDWTHCHVYRPGMIHARTNQAILETAGMVLTYQGQIISALYSAYCNGHTINNEDAWPETPVPPVPYLRGVPCPCRDYVIAHPDFARRMNYGPEEKKGHGTGLCVVGAMAMAAAGKTYLEILGHYYQGTEVRLLQ